MVSSKTLSAMTLTTLVFSFAQIGWCESPTKGTKSGESSLDAASSNRADSNATSADEKSADEKPADEKFVSKAESNEADSSQSESAKDESAKDVTASNDDGDKEDGEKEDGSEKILEGHSFHGEAFNEGPRQAAYLMQGTGNVSFPVQSKKENVQQFINQGVGQLHGFWYFEAERSFRQAAAFDPECAAAYWGMAMANSKNRDRAQKFSTEAIKHRDKASPRVQKYIDALDKLLKAKDKDKTSASEKYIQSLERIYYDHPDDVEALAFVALHLWEGRGSGLKITSHLAVDALIGQILTINPQHPVHHYRIHLWDYEKPERALASAAACGQSAPSIAHMWHMPGHIYSRVERYEDAVWQQEASARTDHAQMMRDRVLPDQIHNFAHNNEWLIRNLMFIGRVRDALDLAKNMIELPRHPKYNLVTKGGTSSSYGRQRLFQVLNQGELWDELIELSDTPYLEPTDDFREQIKRQRMLGRAFFRSDRFEDGLAMIDELEERRCVATAEKTSAIEKAEQEVREKDGQQEKEATKDSTSDEADSKDDDDAINSADDDSIDTVPADGESANENPADTGDAANNENKIENSNADFEKLANEIKKAKKKASEEHDRLIKHIETALHELYGYVDAHQGDSKEAYKKFKKASISEKWFLARARFEAGEENEAVEDLKKYADSHQGESLPLAYLAELAWDANKRDVAQEAFEKLQAISGNIDLSSGVFSRLSIIANECGSPEDWRRQKPPATDVGDRPDLDSLGPFRWKAPFAPDWELRDHKDQMVSLSDYRGRPVVVIFYLGFGCLHCAEQLQSFAPQVQAFNKAGIEVLGISSESQADLKESLNDFLDFPIRLVCNEDLDVFKQYRVQDDFEKKPLHGTFLIDGKGRIRWHDISYEPFMDHEFVLNEAVRLLSWE